MQVSRLQMCKKCPAVQEKNFKQVCTESSAANIRILKCVPKNIHSAVSTLALLLYIIYYKIFLSPCSEIEKKISKLSCERESFFQDQTHIKMYMYCKSLNLIEAEKPLKRAGLDLGGCLCSTFSSRQFRLGLFRISILVMESVKTKMSPVRCHHPESLLVPNADFGRQISISKQESK